MRGRSMGEEDELEGFSVGLLPVTESIRLDMMFNSQPAFNQMNEMVFNGSDIWLGEHLLNYCSR